MDIKKYIDYFHDGGLFGVKTQGNNMELFLQSCEIDEDEPVDRELLSREGGFRGKLCLTNVKWMKIDDDENKEIPWKDYDDGGIINFEIDDNLVLLVIHWTNWNPKPYTCDMSKIEIEAEQIDWENIPDLPDDCCQEEREA